MGYWLTGFYWRQVVMELDGVLIYPFFSDYSLILSSLLLFPLQVLLRVPIQKNGVFMALLGMAWPDLFLIDLNESLQLPKLTIPFKEMSSQCCVEWIDILLGTAHKHRNMYSIFADAGLLHLLVVSGFHITLIGGLANSLVRIPFRIFYGLHLLTYPGWRVADMIAGVLGMVTVIMFCLSIGLTPPVQRALILFLMSRLERFRATSALDRIGWLIVIQTVLFPQDCFSKSFIISWLCYILVVAAMNMPRYKTLYLQVHVSILSLTFFNYLSIPGIVANILLVPLFPVFIGAGVTITSGMTCPQLESFYRLYLDAIVYTSKIAVENSGFFLIARFPWFFMVSVMFLGTAIVLKSLENLSIRKESN